MATERWQIDSSHSGIHFSVRHLVIAKVRGQFGRWTGTVEVPDGDFARASVGVVIDASSIDTGVEQRDAHLKSPDFFDVDRYPEITFTTRQVKPQRSGGFRLIGDLVIHGVTREATFDVEAHGQTRDPWGNQRAAFTARTSVDRKNFGLTWNQALETGGVMVGDRIDIEVEVEAVRQAEAKVA